MIIKFILRAKKIQSQFLAICLMISVVSLILLAAMSFGSAYHMTVKRTMEEVAGNLETASNLLDIHVQEVETLARDILNSDVVYQALTSKPSDETNIYPEAGTTLALNQELKRLSLNAKDIASVYLFNWDGLKYCFRRDGYYSAITFNLEENTDQAWYKRTVAANGYEQYFLSDIINPPGDGGRSYTVSASKLLLDLNTNEPFGLLVINVSSGYYNKVLPSATKETGYALADPAAGEVNYISAVSAEMSEEIKKEILEELTGEKDREEPYIVTSRVNQRTGWSLYHVARKIHYIESISLMVITILIGLGFLFSLSYFFSLIASRKITKPLNQLSYVMQEVQDTGFPPEDVFFDDDEVGRIGQQFMSLFKKNEELNEQLTAISVLQKEAEIKALQAQINPHFLYNSLSTIYWLSKSGRNEDAAKMSITLSELFKTMISKRDDELVTIKEELEYIDKYLYIQNERYRGRIQIHKKIDDSIMGEKILKLTLQPLVENAVCHGLELKVGEWHLEITGERNREFITFMIRDNGVGIDDIESATKSGYALRNVMKRIRLFYGEKCGVNISSSKDRGTAVVVSIRAV